MIGELSVGHPRKTECVRGNSWRLYRRQAEKEGVRQHSSEREREFKIVRKANRFSRCGFIFERFGWVEDGCAVHTLVLTGSASLVLLLLKERRGLLLNGCVCSE